MAKYCICDMCGAHFDIEEQLNEVHFIDSSGYADNAFDLCNECYDLLRNTVKSLTKVTLNDIINALDGIGV